MKLILLIFALLPNHAHSIGQAQLHKLGVHCEELKASAKDHKYESSENCNASLLKMEQEIAAYCEGVHKAFIQSHMQAKEAVKKANAWMKEQSVVTETETTVNIRFNLTDDPSYPLRNFHDFVNEALRAGWALDDPVNAEWKKLNKAKSCRGSAARQANLKKEWDKIYKLYEKVALVLSDYLINQQNAHRNGAFQEAADELEYEGIGTIEPAR